MAMLQSASWRSISPNLSTGRCSTPLRDAAAANIALHRSGSRCSPRPASDGVGRTRRNPSRMRSPLRRGDVPEGAVDEDCRKLARTDLSLAAAHFLGKLDELPPTGLSKRDQPLDRPAWVCGTPRQRTADAAPHGLAVATNRGGHCLEDRATRRRGLRRGLALRGRSDPSHSFASSNSVMP